MSVSLTEEAVRARYKTVTRRRGWTFLKPGDRLTLCRKVMGRKPGEPLERLAEVEVVSVRREPLNAITDEDVKAEGTGHRAWSDYSRAEAFVDWYCRKFKVKPDTDITRIEWRYL